MLWDLDHVMMKVKKLQKHYVMSIEEILMYKLEFKNFNTYGPYIVRLEE